MPAVEGEPRRVGLAGSGGGSLSPTLTFGWQAHCLLLASEAGAMVL